MQNGKVVGVAFQGYSGDVAQGRRLYDPDASHSPFSYRHQGRALR